MTPEPVSPLVIFFSYAHEDEALRDELDKYLVGLKRYLRVVDLYDRNILAGSEWAEEIREQMNRADIILLLVSQDFIVSDFCHGTEMEIAMRRHHEGTARVLPVVLRPCTWEDEPFGKLQVLPTDAIPVTKWANRDDAFLDVARGIRRVARELLEKGRGDGGAAAAGRVARRAGRGGGLRQRPEAA